MSGPSTVFGQMTSVMAGAASYMRLPVIASSGITAVATALLYFKQNELIYPRNLPPGIRTQVPRPPDFGITDFEDLTISTPDGESLHAYFISPSNKRMVKGVTILMFHGNAGNIGYRIPIAGALEENFGCHVLMVEYRGYGLSTGTPDERGLMIDAQAGLDYIRQREDIEGSKIVVYGQSLGGAVSTKLVAQNQDAGDIKGLILENTFTTMKKLIPSIIPPAKYVARLCHQLWPTEDVLPRITKVPVLFLSGLKDEIVPPSHMEQLYSICQAPTKVWKELPNGCHNETYRELYYFKYIGDFIENHVLKPEKEARQSQRL